MGLDTDTYDQLIALCRGFRGAQCLEIARRLGLEVIVSQAQRNDQSGSTNRIIEKLEAQTLESRNASIVHRCRTENLKFNRVLKKLYNELIRERETELNKARKEAQEIVTCSKAESLIQIYKVSMPNRN